MTVKKFWRTWRETMPLMEHKINAADGFNCSLQAKCTFEGEESGLRTAGYMQNYTWVKGYVKRDSMRHIGRKTVDGIYGCMIGGRRLLSADVFSGSLFGGRRLTNALWQNKLCKKIGGINASLWQADFEVDKFLVDPGGEWLCCIQVVVKGKLPLENQDSWLAVKVKRAETGKDRKTDVGDWVEDVRLKGAVEQVDERRWSEDGRQAFYGCNGIVEVESEAKQWEELSGNQIQWRCDEFHGEKKTLQGEFILGKNWRIVHFCHEMKPIEMYDVAARHSQRFYEWNKWLKSKKNKRNTELSRVQGGECW